MALENGFKMPVNSFSLRRRIATGAVLVVAIFAPTPAFALESLIEIATTKLAEYAQVLAKEGAMLAKWTYDKTQNLLASQSSAESVVASTDKLLAGNKELTQARLNYGAARQASGRYEDALDLFTSPSAKPAQVCELIGTTGEAAAAGNDIREVASASTQQASTRALGVESAATEAKNLLANYRSNYCSPHDVKRGFCATTATDPQMYGASLQAASLLLPAANETYNENEVRAAEDYIKTVTDPVPNELLPKALDTNSAAAKKFNLAMMSSQAEMSVAQYSLNTILASRTAFAKLGSTALGESPSAISSVGLMKQLVEKKHGDADYQTRLSGMNEAALLQEFNLQMAGRNWMDFQAYGQDERIEALIATRLGVLASERNARQLALARGMTGGR